MNVVIESLPLNLEAFKAMPQFDLRQPENTCTLFLCALNLFVHDCDAGVEAINLLKGPKPLSPFDINFLRDRVMDKPYLPLVYFEGATPDNDYQPDMPLTLRLFEDQRPQDVEAGYLRLYLHTAGADSKRAIQLRQKDDQWFIWDYPGIVMDVRKPKKESDW